MKGPERIGRTPLEEAGRQDGRCEGHNCEEVCTPRQFLPRGTGWGRAMGGSATSKSIKSESKSRIRNSSAQGRGQR